MAKWFLCAVGATALAALCQGQSLTLSASQSSLTIYPGQQDVPVTITTNPGSYGPVTISMTGLPSGITLSPLVLTAGSSGTLYVSASSSAGQEGFPATGPGAPSQNTAYTVSANVVGAADSVQAAFPFSFTVSISNAAFAPAAANINLPVVSINTNGIPVVSKVNDVPGTITITSPNGLTSYLPNTNDSDNTATFHVHGNSTADMPKLGYHVSLNTGLDLLNTMGLQCPYVSGSGAPACDHARGYVLLANYDDKTFLRTWSAGMLARAIPIGNGYLNSPADSPTPSGTGVLMPWAPHSLFVELFLNGAYEGNYLLMEDISVDTHRIHINGLTQTDTSAAQVTGGYLMEIDSDQNQEPFFFNTPTNIPIALIDPGFTPEVPQQTSYITSYMATAENALFAANFTDPVQGWRAYFDEASAINYYIVNEIMSNTDMFIKSNYFYKDRNNPLIYMGPVWDFDGSAGNVNYLPSVNPTVLWVQVQASWYSQWFSDPGFKADAIRQWNALRNNGVFTRWLTAIQQQAQALEQSQANNFARWPILGLAVWPNAEVAGSYDGEVQYFLNWLQLRIAYLDSLFNNKAPTSVTLEVESGMIRRRDPLTLTAYVTGTNSLSGVVSFLSNGVLIGTGELSPGGTATLTLDNLPDGANSLQAVYNGDSVNALSLSTVQMMSMAEPGPVILRSAPRAF
jgi:hypothetical protein